MEALHPLLQSSIVAVPSKPTMLDFDFSSVFLFPSQIARAISFQQSCAFALTILYACK